MPIDPNGIVHRFCKAVKLADISLTQDAIVVETLTAPHRPPSALPKGKMAVYVFSYKGQTLKVGKVGSKSQARYVSQHYNPGSAPSTLASSLLMYGTRLGIGGIDKDTVSEWIKSNTDRHNFILDAGHGPAVLNLLEAFVQCCLRPEFEGFDGQAQRGERPHVVPALSA